jgi:hypothetical protein
MKERVKELAEFHSLNINLMQAIYEDIRFSKKEWVGLTDEELLDLADMAYANDLELLQTLQVKLKEKNT